MANTVTIAEGAPAGYEDRINAKQVIMAAANLFAAMDLGLTDADSPATISQDDAAYADFFDAVVGYRGVEGLEVSNANLNVTIVAVEAATARGSETNYRFTIEEATMDVNGVPATYVKGEGLSVG